jgi:hypothetical protein
VYMSVLDQDSDPKEWLSWVLTLGPAPSKGELLAAGGKAVLLNRALYNVLAQCTSATSGLMVRQAGAGQGLAAWLALTTWFNPVRASDRASSLTMIMNPQNCKDIARLHVALEQWELRVADHESRFNVVIDGDVKIAALLSMLPEDLYNARFKGADFAEHSQLRSSLVSYMTSKRPTLQVTASHKGDAMDIGEIIVAEKPTPDIAKQLADMSELLGAFTKGKGKGAKGKGQWAWPSASPETWKGDSSWIKPAAPAKGKGKDQGKPAKGKGKTANPDVVCYRCGGKGHRQTQCGSPLNNLDGEDWMEDVQEEEGVDAEADG